MNRRNPIPKPLHALRHLGARLRSVASRIITGIGVAAVLAMSLGVLAGASSASAASVWVSPLGTRGMPPVVDDFNPPKEKWQAGHRGVDLAARPGSSVNAAGVGVVTFAGIIAGRGVVTVTHGDLRTTYEPVDPTVSVGSTVSAGQVIGRVGGGGHCSLRCLHWGLLRGETYLNPMLLLQWRSPVLKSPQSGGNALRERSGIGSVGSLAEPSSATRPRGAATAQGGTDDGETEGQGVAEAGGTYSSHNPPTDATGSASGTPSPTTQSAAESIPAVPTHPDSVRDDASGSRGLLTVTAIGSAGIVVTGIVRRRRFRH